MLAGNDRWSRMIYHAVNAENPIDRVIIERRTSHWEFVLRRIRRLGFVRVMGQVLFRVAIYPVLYWFNSKRAEDIIRETNLDDSEIPREKIVKVESANSVETITLLRNLNPSIVLINGTRILSSEVLGAVKAPFINMHAGVTPLYRGVHGAYWALRDGRPELCGVTVHYVDTGIDTGAILGQATITPSNRDNFATYQLLQWAAGLPLLKEAVQRELAGVSIPLPPPRGISRLWSHPTAWDYLWGWMADGCK